MKRTGGTEREYIGMYIYVYVYVYTLTTVKERGRSMRPVRRENRGATGCVVGQAESALESRDGPGFFFSFRIWDECAA